MAYPNIFRGEVLALNAGATLALNADELNRLRSYLYTKYADPLFFKWQREEGTKEAWVAMVNEIKTTYPDEV